MPTRTLAALLAFATMSFLAMGAPARGSERAELDLPAMVLLPSDLAAATGLGYVLGHVSHSFQTPEAIAREFVEMNDVPEPDARAAFLASGLQRRYVQWRSVVDPTAGDTSSHDARWVRTSVFEFASAAAASAAFPRLVGVLAGQQRTDLESAARPGEESALTHGEREGVWGDPYSVLSLSFRLGALVANVTVDDHIGDAVPAEAEALAGRLVSRIEAAIAGRGPGLSRFVLRFPDEVVMSGPFEGYNLFAGEVVVDGERFVDVVRTWQAEPAANAGATQGYNLSNALVLEGGGWAASHGSLVYRFADAAAASAWLRALPDRLRASSAGDLAVLPAPGIGDEAFFATYQSEPTDTIRHHRVDGVRVGNLAALVSGTEVAPAAARALLEAQAACLDADGCAGPVPVPDGVLGYAPQD